MKTYEKISDTELGIKREVTDVIPLEALKQRESEILQTLADYQSELSIIQGQISEAVKLGVVEKVEPIAEPIEEIIVD